MSNKPRRINNKAKNLCGQCRMEVKEDDDYIQCSKCAKILHALCTNLNKSQYESLLTNESEKFICSLCEESGGTVKDELNHIRKQLTKLDRLSDLQETMNFMSKQYGEILGEVVDNKKKIETMQKENRLFKNEIKGLKGSIKYLNDELVKKDCLISGVIVRDGATAVDTLMAISKAVGVELMESDINAAYFIKKRDTSTTKSSTAAKKRTMVVKFESKKSKDKLMLAKPKLQESQQTKSVYINDVLSRETLNVFKYAKALKSTGYELVYTYNGRVYAKRSKLSRPKLIRNEEEVDDMLMNATTNKVSEHRSNLQPSATVVDSDIGDNGHYMQPV